MYGKNINLVLKSFNKKYAILKQSVALVDKS